MLNPKNLVHQEKQLVKNTQHVDFDQNSIKNFDVKFFPAEIPSGNLT